MTASAQAAPPLTAFREVVRTLAAPLKGPLPPAVAREIAQVLVADSRRRFATGTGPDGRKWPALRRARPTGGNLPLLDSGLLRASVFAVPTPTGAVVASNLPQAALHEFGGTVRARRTKYLAIPLTREARRAGSPRRFRGALHFRPFKRRGAGGVLYERRGKAARDQYLLVPQVTVPARPFLAPSEPALRLIDEIVGAATDTRLTPAK